MLWRAWLLRMIVGSFCAAVALAGWFIYLHTNSEAIRQRVIFELENHLTGVNVEVGAAWLRPLGGISLRDVRLARRDDPNHPFLIVPEATIYHDKQQFAQGRMAIRKFEFQQPSMFIRRDAEGNWNLAGICKLQPREGLAPTVVVRKGMLRVEDRLRCSSGQVFEVNEINLTMVNDPLTIMTFQGEGRSIL